MSKSLGNVISPFDIIKDYGADILRLWVASSDYNEDIRISPEILSRLSEAYRKIRNTVRFILSNLNDFDPSRDKISYEDLKKIDKWILSRAQDVLGSVTKAYEDFEFHKAYKRIYDFCNEDLSMYYLDMAKGRLYTFAKDSRDRRSSQTVIYEALQILVRLIAPILTFTAEEIWQCMPKEDDDKLSPSIHLQKWPLRNTGYAQDDLRKAGKDIDSELKDIISLIPIVAKSLEEKRGAGDIGSSFDAKINILTNNQNRCNYLESLKADLLEIFKVSQVDIGYSSKYSDLSIVVGKADGNKCVRCWNYSSTVGTSVSHPLICSRCLKAIEKGE